MPTIKELLRTGRREDLWQMCCGFLDLNIEQFMTIQRRLLLEQIELLNQSNLGKKIMGGLVPQDMDEFRKRVPLTTYKDYCPELSEKQEDQLPVKPLLWQHTSGRAMEYPFKWESIKWVPITPAYCRELATLGTACAIFASCKSKGDVSAMKKNLKYIYAVAPRPYTSGTFAYIASTEVEGISLPPLELAEKLTFEERIAHSFKQALSEGFDFYFGVSVALVAIGERMGQQLDKVDVKALLKQPKALMRLSKGLIKSKIAGRKLQPKDLWDIKGIMGSGTDGTIFKNVIKDTWGKYPLNTYVSTEAGIVATQTWDYGSMTFTPSLNFLEFIPEAEYSRWQIDKSYVPKCVLFNELRAGEKYELVISNFHGGPLVRYRTGDVIKITSLRNNKLNISLPQMEFEGRVDDIMDIGGFIRLTEKVIWQAVSDADVPYVDWAARREMRNNLPILHLYVELKDQEYTDAQNIAKRVYAQLKKMDEDFMYGNVESVLNTMPIEVTLLPKGAFDNYLSLRKAEGADLAHLKPKHINPPDRELAILTKQPAVPHVGKVTVGAPAAS